MTKHNMNDLKIGEYKFEKMSWKRAIVLSLFDTFFTVLKIGLGGTLVIVCLMSWSIVFAPEYIKSCQEMNSLIESKIDI